MKKQWILIRLIAAGVAGSWFLLHGSRQPGADTVRANACPK